MNRMQDKLKASISPAKTGETNPAASPEVPAAAPATAASKPVPRNRPAAKVTTKPAAKQIGGNQPAGTPPMSVWPD